MEKQFVNPPFASHPRQTLSWKPVASACAVTPEGVRLAAVEECVGSDTPPGVFPELDDLRGRTARIAHLMAAAGHDLRQPLQIIMFALNRLEPVITEPALREWMKIAREQAWGLNAGLSEIAVAARLRDPQIADVAVDDVLQSAASGWRYHADMQGIRLCVVRSSVRVRTDARLLSTIVRNLVGNAVRYTRQGGVVVGVRNDPDYLRLDVVDSGQGLSPEEVSQMRVGAGRRERTSDGLGLGLIIVQDACERLGGALHITSVQGRGTRFSLLLPRT